MWHVSLNTESFVYEDNGKSILLYMEYSQTENAWVEHNNDEDPNSSVAQIKADQVANDKVP